MKKKYYEAMDICNSIDTDIEEIKELLKKINNEDNLSEEEKEELYSIFLKEKIYTVTYYSTKKLKSIKDKEKLEILLTNLFTTIEVIPKKIIKKYFNEFKLKYNIYMSYLFEISTNKEQQEIDINMYVELLKQIHNDISNAEKEIKNEVYKIFIYTIYDRLEYDYLPEKFNNKEELENLITNLITTIKEVIPKEILEEKILGEKFFSETKLRKKLKINNSSPLDSNNQEKLKDQVRRKIYLLIPLDNYQSIEFNKIRNIIEDINKIKNQEVKYELSSELIEGMEEYLINAKWFENEEDLKTDIDIFINDIEENLDIDEGVIKENNFKLKNIKKKRKTKKVKYLKEITEIEKLDDKIKEKENNIYNRMMPSNLLEVLKIDELLKKYEEEITELNKEPKKNKKNIEELTYEYNERKKEKEILIKNKEYCSSKVLKDIIEIHFEDDYDKIKKEAIVEFEKNIDKEITKLEEEKTILEKSIKSSDILQQEYDELKLKLESSKLTIKEESKIVKVFIDNKAIISIKDNHLANLYKDYQKNPEKNERKIKDRVLKLKENEIQDNGNKISRLIEKKHEIESKKEIKKEFDSINELKKQKKAYYNILSDGISQYEEKENDENVNEEIENFVNNHEQLKVFEGYERKKELIQELVEQIQEGIKTKPVIFTEGMKSLWNKVLKKALPFALGTVAGFKLSMLASAFPLVREVLLITSLTKITISTLNKLADKAKQYEETGECKGKKPGKLATGALKLRNKVTGIVSDKKPNLVEKASKMKEKMKQNPINYFLNGVSIGYIVGSIYQMPKGIFDGTKDATNAVVDNATQNAGTVETVTETVETVTEAVTETAEIIDFNNIDTTINNLEKLMEQGLIPKEGTVMDLSSILRGYISSDATSSVALMEEVANDVIFEKIAASPTGELMCHFKQANGLGYSWVKLEDVLKVAGKTLVKTMTK